MLTRFVPLAVAAALALSACGGGGAAPENNEVSVTGTGSLEFQPEQLEASAGEITVTLTSEGVNHTFVVEDANGDTEVVAAGIGETESGTITLEPGTYTFYCDVPGHREQGMEGTLTVTGA